MVLPEADWKNQPRQILNWFIVVIGLVLLSVYLSLWWTVGAPLYLGIGLIFAMWLSVYFTDYWQPILYLFIAMAVALVTVGLFFVGAWIRPLGKVAIFLNIVVILASVYLAAYEEQEKTAQ